MTFNAQNLSCIRANRPLFKHLSFELKPGNLLLIEGKNGAGKTSLLRILCGLRMADHGDILWQNQSIHSDRVRFAKNLSWLGHQNPLKAEQTAMENLQTLSSLGHTKDVRLEEALIQVGLGKVKHKAVKTFSAGMQRRLALAMLLIKQTPLWILDEPQTALDKHGIALFEKMAHQHLKNDGMIIMTSHHAVGIEKQFIQNLNLGTIG